jgi:hypothetical protein
LEKYDMDRAIKYAKSIMEFVRGQFPEQFASNGKSKTEKPGKSWS